MAFKSKAKEILKEGGISALEVGALGTSMILTKKFLDFNTLFKNKIAADPTFAKKWFIVHEGGIKLAAGVIAAAFIPKQYPWLKIIALGIAAGGFIQEVRVWTTDSAGNAFFDKIGATEDMEGDAEMKRIAEQYARQMNMSGIDRYGSQVAGIDTYGSQVAGLDQSYNMSTAGKMWNIPLVAPMFH